MEAQSSTGVTISEMIRNGKIVPAHLYLSLLKGAMEKQPGMTCLIDGFPRSLDNLTVSRCSLC